MDLLRTKTFWTGVAGLATALGSYLSGQADAVQAAQMALTGLAAICLRAGLLKQPPNGGQAG